MPPPSWFVLGEVGIGFDFVDLLGMALPMGGEGFGFGATFDEMIHRNLRRTETVRRYQGFGRLTGVFNALSSRRLGHAG